MIEMITHNDTIVAILVSKDYKPDGIAFITPKEFSLQLGYMNRPTGYEIAPHEHHPVRRETIGTQEMLFIKSGVIRVDFYSSDRIPLGSRELSAGDAILLASAGHGITVLESAVMVEVKNGPYASEEDKERFESKRRDSDAAGQRAAS